MHSGQSFGHRTKGYYTFSLLYLKSPLGHIVFIILLPKYYPITEAILACPVIGGNSCPGNRIFSRIKVLLTFASQAPLRAFVSDSIIFKWEEQHCKQHYFSHQTDGQLGGTQWTYYRSMGSVGCHWYSSCFIANTYTQIWTEPNRGSTTATSFIVYPALARTHGLKS